MGRQINGGLSSLLALCLAYNILLLFLCQKPVVSSVALSPFAALGMHTTKKARSRLKPPAHHMSRSVNPSPAQRWVGGGAGTKYCCKCGTVLHPLTAVLKCHCPCWVHCAVYLFMNSLPTCAHTCSLPLVVRVAHRGLVEGSEV